MLWLPETALEPDHDPDAAQDVALVADQVRLEDPDGATDVGDAVNDNVGADVIATVVLAVRLPPLPEQVKRYSRVPLKGPVFRLPLTLLEPLQAPLAVQLSALATDQVRRAPSPALTLAGVAVKLITGGSPETVAYLVICPPMPTQVSL